MACMFVAVGQSNETPFSTRHFVQEDMNGKIYGLSV